MATATPLRPPSVEIDGLPRLMPFKHESTEDQVFTHRSYFPRPATIFEDPPNDPSPDYEVLEYIGVSVLSMAVGLLTKRTYPGLRVGPHSKIRSLVLQNVTIAAISEHYGLSKRLRANQSQLFSLQRTISVQGWYEFLFNDYLSLDIWASSPITADLFEAYIGGLHDDWGWEYVKPWLYKVLLPYTEEAYMIVQGSYYQSEGHCSPNLGGGAGPRSAPFCPSDGPSSSLIPQINLGASGVSPSPRSF